jgi:HSP20 family protein
MALVRWDPTAEVDSLRSDLDRLFDGFFSRRPGNGARSRWLPAMDLVETDDHLVLRADLPGLTEEDVNIEVKDNVLTVSGERRSEHEEKREGYYRVERGFGNFSRSLTLPDGVDADKVTANFDKGVLEVRIPKPEERKPQRIEIGATKSIEGTGEEK